MNASLDAVEYAGYVDFVNYLQLPNGNDRVSKSSPGVQPPNRRIGRAGELLLSNKLLTLATLLRRSASVVYRRELGLSQSEWRVVAIVGDAAPLSLSQLVETLGLDKGQISRGVTNLVARRILTRVADESDSREIRIDLTPHGREIFASLMTIALARNRELVAGLDKVELTTIFAELDRLIGNAKAMLTRSQVDQN